MTAAEIDEIENRYVVRFAEMPPLTSARGMSARAIARMMMQALERGRALTPEDFEAVKVGEPTPPGVDIGPTERLR